MPKQKSLLLSILSDLPKLAQKDLATVRAAADSLLGKSGGDLKGTEALLFESVTSLAQIKITYRAFKQLSSYKEWVKNAAEAAQFIDSLCPGEKRVTVVALIHMILSTLADDLKARGAPMTLGVLVSNLGRLPEIFETMYPNYRSSGMVHLIIKALQPRRTSDEVS